MLCDTVVTTQHEMTSLAAASVSPTARRVAMDAGLQHTRGGAWLPRLLEPHVVPSNQVAPSVEEAAAPILDSGVLDLKGLASRVGPVAEALGPALTVAHPSLL